MDPVVAAALESWSLPPGMCVAVVLVALVYTRGWRQLRQQMPQHFSTWRWVAFHSGLAVTLLAVTSPLDAFGGLLLQVHMTQHLLLMMIAPPLLWLGAPATPLLRGLPQAVLKDAVGPFLAWPALQRCGRFVGHPVVCWLAFVITTWLWHVPVLYELALRSPFWHAVEHACFLGTGLLFWFPVIQPWPSVALWPRWAMIPYLLLADVQNTIFSALFVFAERVIYPAYLVVPRLWGTSVLADQAAAGAIMWVPGSIVLLVPVGLIITGRLSPSFVYRANGRSAGTSVERPRRHGTAWDLLAVPMAGAVIRSRRCRHALQALMLVLAAAIVIDGLLGPQVSPLNLAGVLPWTYWRGLVVIALLAGGNVFCMACPFMLPRTLGRRWLPARSRWPKPLRTKWVAVALLLLYLWAYESLRLWDSPWWTAWITIGYFVAAFAVDGWFRGASFCKYVCPIGQFHFVHAQISPLEVKVRDPAVCGRCRTYDCIRGNAQQNGCELNLFLPKKVGNLDCTFCLDCVRACPHDNVGVLAVAPGSRLIGNPYRSSLRRLSRRTDVAALALVLVFGAFVNAGGMVAPVLQWERQLTLDVGMTSLLPVTTLFLSLSLLVVAPVVAVLCAWLGRTSSALRLPLRELGCRFVLALVPLGFSMWLAHFTFHLQAGAGSVIPVVQRVLDDVGGHVGSPLPAPSTAEWMRPLELLMLDAGLLLTLYVSWCIAKDIATRAATAIRLLVPWASVAVVLYTVGVWIIFQPMQMRGMLMH